MSEYGILGGTFDPIHIGHLFIAEEIRSSYNLDKIIFVPNGDPPHKSRTTDKFIRYEMVKLAIEDNKNFEVSDIEINILEDTYTINTIEAFKKRNPKDSYRFIFGADSLLNIHKWKDYKKLLSENNFIVIERPGFNLEDLDIESRYLKNIDIISTLGLEIDSTGIRNRVKTGQTIKYLVKSSVEDYIYVNNLYK